MSWTVRRFGWDLLIVQEDNPNIDIASMTERLNWKANARLIAAAPDMLELLEQLEWAGCDYLGNPICPRCEQRKTARHDMDCALNAAIKKAKGQQ